MKRCLGGVALLWGFTAPAGAGDFTNFESSHVHPLALSDDGRWLCAVNTPEARLSIFRVSGPGWLRFRTDVPVGLGPVSVVPRPGSGEVWVVNHLSDSVSVVDVAAGRVIDTIQVGDEPTDVAFARGRAFVTLTGQFDFVRVYDAETRQNVTDIRIFGDDPRALAVSPDGSTVGLVVLESGNASTAVPRGAVQAAGGPPPPSPPRSPRLTRFAPREALIVQRDAATGRWLDDAGGDWSRLVPYDVPDYDLFLIDAEADPPVVVERVSGIGTSLFELAFQPETGEAWIPNTDARNVIRFEPNLRGHLVETRITRVDPASASIRHVDLNPHIDYAISPGPEEERERSLAQPGDGVFDRKGSRFYLTAFGSAKVAVLDGASGEVLDRIDVPGGPSGVALLERGLLRRLFVLSRFDHVISVVDPRRGRVVQEIGVAGPRGFDPSPPEIREGRRLLYDARLSSGHGDLSCASCHVFGNWDGLAWDLGDPQGAFVSYREADWVVFAPNPTNRSGFDPMKGPMMTQTLRGLLGHEPFHWRGDRRNFQHFNGAFETLLGRDGPIPEADMDLFADFVMTIRFPPNPFRNVDGTLPGENIFGDAGRGGTVFLSKRTLGKSTCNKCHRLPTGTTTNLTGGVSDQDKKIPQLRNLYEKVGFDVLRPRATENIGSREVKRGFGWGHSGATSPIEFLISGFDLVGREFGDVFLFLLMFPTETPACVGRQVRVDAVTARDAGRRDTIDALVGQAAIGRCDLVAHGWLGGVPVGYGYLPAEGLLRSDAAGVPDAAIDGLLASLDEEDDLTFMGVPVGSGERLGRDRDRDGCLDGDERAAGTDPASPGEPLPDADGDGIPDERDRCPLGHLVSRGGGFRDVATCRPYEESAPHPGTVCVDPPLLPRLLGAS